MRARSSLHKNLTYIKSKRKTGRVIILMVLSEDSTNSKDETMSKKDRILLAEKNLGHLLEWIGRFDTKSSVVLGIDTGMLGALATFAPAFNLWTPLMKGCVILSLILLLVSFLFVYLSNYPRLKGPNNSLFYFGSICRKCFEQYSLEFSGLSTDQCLEDILQQCHRNSEILNKKFANLRWAYRLLLLAVFPWAFTIYLFRVFPLS